MAHSIEEKLLEAIQKDDVKAFDILLKDARCQNWRLGRFPVLSILYLYNSKKITAKHEQNLIKITQYEQKSEPMALSKLFSEKAGKCLRLYLNEVVTPLEMLLILDKTKKLKGIYPLAKPAEEIKNRLKSIYSVKYSLNIKFDGDDIIIDKRPLSSGEKKKIVTACVSAFVAAAIIVATPVTAVSLLPKGDGGFVLDIDLSERTTYTLTQDLIIPANYSVNNTNCNIVGNGHRLVLGKGASLGALGGSISGVEIRTSGAPIFSEISERATISDVTVSVNADVQTAKNSAFIALYNYGTIDGVTVNVSGKVTAVAGSNSGNDELSFGGMVMNNHFKQSMVGLYTLGTIKDCTVNFESFTLVGELMANAAFGGIAGINNGLVQNCTVTGKIDSDTFDLGGACSINYNEISNVVNEATLTQISQNDGWNPVVSGIALNNAFRVISCQNKGALSSKSACEESENPPAVSVSGIVYSNSYDLLNCVNSGSIIAEGAGEAYVGGIASHTLSPLYYCISNGEISVNADTAYVGGIAARTISSIYYCLSKGEISVNAQNARVGGIVGNCEIYKDDWGYPHWGFVENCIGENIFDVTVDGDETCVGGIAGYVWEGTYVDDKENPISHFGSGVVNCYFLGDNAKDLGYFGNIVGACGANIYTRTDLEYNYFNFENNYFLSNSYFACGATVTFDKEDKDKERFKAVTENIGATAAERDKIEKMEGYLAILQKLGL